MKSTNAILIFIVIIMIGVFFCTGDKIVSNNSNQGNNGTGIQYEKLYFSDCDDQTDIALNKSVTINPEAKVISKAVTKNVTGTIKDLSGKIAKGISVSLVKTGLSTKTDDNGNFSFDMTNNGSFSGDTLLISGTGYLDKKFLLSSDSEKISLIVWNTGLKIEKSEMAGWTEHVKDFSHFDTIQLYSLINGGATIYHEHGFTDGIFQFFDKNDLNSFTVFIFRCKNTTWADSLFKAKRDDLSASMILPGYDSTQVLGSESLGGAMYVAHIDNFFVEIEMSGYVDKTVLQQDAKSVLSICQSKIDELKKDSSLGVKRENWNY